MKNDPEKSQSPTTAEEFIDALLTPEEQAALDADLQKMTKLRANAGAWATGFYFK